MSPKKFSMSKLCYSGFSFLLLLTLVFSLAACSAATAEKTPENPDVLLSSTTSTRDSGLMDVLQPLFEETTGYRLTPIYNGSGAAMAMGEKGEADVLLVHAPASEVTFMQNGYGVERKLVMHNDFVVVGPPSDPAGIKGMTGAVDIMTKLFDTGSEFYSRGDNSGTHQLEKKLWTAAGLDPVGQFWYYEANLGMGDLLRIASEKEAYTITDRATYLNNQSTLALDILVEGDPLLLNIYHVITIDPALSDKINAEGAEAFANFMVSDEAQAIITEFGIEKFGQPLFFADADKTEADLGSQ